MTTPHPHAEFFRAIADGDGSILDWECRWGNLREGWEPMSPRLIEHAYLRSDGFEVRRKPTPKVIDWSQLGRHLPVKVWDDGIETFPSVVMLSDYAERDPDAFYSGDCGWQHASLDTGLWVFNHDGVNPWPDGVVVAVMDASCDDPMKGPARHWEWKRGHTIRDIIASRFHSLEEGYSFSEGA